MNKTKLTKVVAEK
ncbi:Protein of unknown function [Bacillus wiedmannii]|nr:Protein of unknown function [Bacillus wiedmannii]